MRKEIASERITTKPLKTWSLDVTIVVPAFSIIIVSVYINSNIAGLMHPRMFSPLVFAFYLVCCRLFRRSSALSRSAVSSRSAVRQSRAMRMEENKGVRTCSTKSNSASVLVVTRGTWIPHCGLSRSAGRRSQQFQRCTRTDRRRCGHFFTHPSFDDSAAFVGCPAPCLPMLHTCCSWKRSTWTTRSSSPSKTMTTWRSAWPAALS